MKYLQAVLILVSIFSFNSFSEEWKKDPSLDGKVKIYRSPALSQRFLTLKEDQKITDISETGLFFKVYSETTERGFMTGYVLKSSLVLFEENPIRKMILENTEFKWIGEKLYARVKQANSCFVINVSQILESQSKTEWKNAKEYSDEIGEIDPDDLIVCDL